MQKVISNCVILVLPCKFVYCSMKELVVDGTSELDPKHLCTPASYVILWVNNSSAAPELLSSWTRSLSTDVFSVGIILLELVLRSNAYSITNLNKYETPQGYDQYLFIQDIIYGFRPQLPRYCPECWSVVDEVMYRLCKYHSLLFRLRWNGSQNKEDIPPTYHRWCDCHASSMGDLIVLYLLCMLRDTKVVEECRIQTQGNKWTN